MGWVVNVTLRPLYRLERPGTRCIVGWVGPKGGLDRCGESRPSPPGFYPRTVQPVASHDTDWAMPAILLRQVADFNNHVKVEWTYLTSIKLITN